MAINCTCSTQIPVQTPGSFLKIANRDMMFKPSSASLKKAPFLLRIRACSIKNKVYEDQSEGIVCYQDENGEIVCEGYDEGPRFPRTSKPVYHSRDAEILDLLLQQSWIKIVREEEMNHTGDESVCMREDLNWNGFNSLC